MRREGQEGRQADAVRKAEGMTVTTSEPGTQRKRGTAVGAVRATTPTPSPQSARERAGDAAGTVRALVLGGYGLNCDLETQYVLKLAGAQADLVHVNELIAGEKKLQGLELAVYDLLGAQFVAQCARLPHQGLQE